PFGRAGDSRRDMRGRPGLNPLRYETCYEVKPETLERIKKVSDEMGIEGIVQPEDPSEFHFLGTKYVAGGEAGSHTKANASDLEGNLAAVRGAARQADWVLFSLHAHEGAWNDTERPAEFIEEAARAAVDAGSHAVIGHGHHAMRGIEIREGRPIFYSLGDFIFQNQTVERMPADFYARYKLDPYSGTPADAYDARTEPEPTPGRRKPSWFGDDEKYWISAVPWMRFEGDVLDELRLYPIELGWKKPRSQRGRPMLARGELADRIIDIMAKLSEPYGTEVLNRDGIGVVSL
ncbi:CapA family protein, partial [Candidatus Bathyarchaeota archaeon]